MDLVEINNQVVGMRGVVRQAKVHTIRKLTRRIVGLRKKKGTESQVIQNNQKAQNLVSEAINLKKLDEDQFSKFALMNLKNFADVVKKIKPDDELRCMIRLAEHKSVKNAVKRFRQKHPNWEKQIPTLLKMREIRNKFKVNDKKSKSKQNSNINKRRKPVTEIHPSPAVDSGEIQDKKPKPKQNRKTVTEIQPPPVLISDEIHENKAKSEQNDVKITKIETPKFVAEKSIGETEVKILKLSEMLNENENFVEAPDPERKITVTQDDDSLITDEINLPRQKDSFFLELDEEVPLTTITRNEESDGETHDPIQNYQSKERKRKSQHHTTFPSTTNRNKFKREDSKFQNKPKEAPLHPSWEAKRKLKQQFSAKVIPQGKKILFDD